MKAAQLSLEGVSIGDAFGERFFGATDQVLPRINARTIPSAPWKWTDDTAMTLSIVEVLAAHDGIDRDALARAFARRYVDDPMRGYGSTAHTILQAIGHGVDWRIAAQMPFDGTGSMGNGGAMRAAPIGAYFADDLDRVISHARASAEPTHAHPEGQAGAIAVAVAAALAHANVLRGERFLEEIASLTPKGATKDGILDAARVAPTTPARDAALRLGSGAKVISADTVPFSLWCAAHHLSDFVEALWTTVAGLGDRDTTCAIVGGIVALSAGEASIPSVFRTSREPLAV